MHTCASGAWCRRKCLLSSSFSSRFTFTIHCVYLPPTSLEPTHPVSPWNQSGVRSGDDPWPGRDQVPRRLEGLPPSGHSATAGGHRTDRAWRFTDEPTTPIRRLLSPFVLKSLARIYSFPVVLTEFHDREETNQTTDV